MFYTVQYGDTLTGLAARFLGDRNRWDVIAQANHLSVVRRLEVGQVLDIPGANSTAGPRFVDWDDGAGMGGASGPADQPATSVPGRGFMFILADEVNPLTRKIVRRVAVPVDPLDAEVLQRILNPDVHGFEPRAPGSSVSVGRHVGQNMTNSRYLSASERALGSPRFAGKPYWIDVAKLEASGARVVEAEEIARDLDRVIAKSARNPDLVARLKAIADLSRKVDREVLVEGAVPAGAVKGAGAMAATRGLQFVQGVGIALTVYDLTKASEESIRLHSARPIAVEATKQSGGWAGAMAGARLGAMGGAALGIETGPGAVVTGAIGAVIFGAAGYFGAELLTDWMSR